MNKTSENSNRIKENPKKKLIKKNLNNKLNSDKKGKDNIKSTKVLVPVKKKVLKNVKKVPLKNIEKKVNKNNNTDNNITNNNI